MRTRSLNRIFSSRCLLFFSFILFFISIFHFLFVFFFKVLFFNFLLTATASQRPERYRGGAGVAEWEGGAHTSERVANWLELRSFAFRYFRCFLGTCRSCGPAKLIFPQEPAASHRTFKALSNALWGRRDDTRAPIPGRLPARPTAATRGKSYFPKENSAKTGMKISDAERKMENRRE